MSVFSINEQQLIQIRNMTQMFKNKNKVINQELSYKISLEKKTWANKKHTYDRYHSVFYDRLAKSVFI